VFPTACAVGYGLSPFGLGGIGSVSLRALADDSKIVDREEQSSHQECKESSDGQEACPTECLSHFEVRLSEQYWGQVRSLALRIFTERRGTNRLT